MPQDFPSDQEADDAESEFTRVDLTGRYGRYIEVLGKGALKEVYPFCSVLCQSFIDGLMN
ncbi:putative non-specific serine/threonine protein kinase [Rosa chinensis]|uniref:Putative non-specific serine/threonine protein kinase n=1 Tax=Rosa chinensis TaxID=74649 RepID=A0A2P6P9M0_ROSCH|nr:putative non-specific serine/threonine protein kinase [Rosa chinensis]